MRKTIGSRWIAVLCVLLAVAVKAPAQQWNKPIHIAVDLRDAAKKIYHSKMEFPVSAGPLTLVYPKWIPGEHSPDGPIQEVAGVHFRVNGKDIPWRRDDVDMFAFHCEIPAGASSLEVTLDFLSPVLSDNSTVATYATSKLAILNWHLVSLYPEGPKSDDLTYVASLRLPAGWKYGTALPVAAETPGQVDFQPATFTRLIDSPVLAGQYLHTYTLLKDLGIEHYLHIAGDSEATSVLTPEELGHIRQLVAETGALFGARHYRRYDFLVAVSDHIRANGIEHNESSDNRVPERTWLDPEVMEMQTDLLPHEFFHSWNGKYRRPAGLATPDYQQPMKGDLLWVYEGLTQYYGVFLAARSGFWTPERLRENLAYTAAYLNDRPGRTWRDLEDTAIAAQLLYGMRDGWSSWRRGVDFYDESTLIWLEADSIIRQQSGGKKSLDDFCRKFHGGENTGPMVVPYTLADVVGTLNEIAPYDWKTFLTGRLTSHGPGAPLQGLENTGWKLVFSSAMNEHQRAMEDTGRMTDVQFSLGMILHNPGGDNSDEVDDVIPGSPASKAGIAPGMRLLAVNGRRWTPDILREAIRAAKNSDTPIQLLTENDDYFHTYDVDYHGGERYPHLEKLNRADLLSGIAQRRAPAVSGSN